MLMDQQPSGNRTSAHGQSNSAHAGAASTPTSMRMVPPPIVAMASASSSSPALSSNSAATTASLVQSIQARAQQHKSRAYKKYTPEQLHVLETMYRANSFPTRHEKEEIAAAFGRTLTSVTVWFENRRRKAKTPGSGVDDAPDSPTFDQDSPSSKSKRGRRVHSTTTVMGGRRRSPGVAAADRHHPYPQPDSESDGGEEEDSPSLTRRASLASSSSQSPASTVLGRSGVSVVTPSSFPGVISSATTAAPTAFSPTLRAVLQQPVTPARIAVPSGASATTRSSASSLPMLSTAAADSTLILTSPVATRLANQQVQQLQLQQQHLLLQQPSHQQLQLRALTLPPLPQSSMLLPPLAASQQPGTSVRDTYDAAVLELMDMVFFRRIHFEMR